MSFKIESDDETDFIGFSIPTQKNEEEVAEAIALAKQLHVYKPGIEFVPGSKLEVLEARDNKWYLCKVVEVDWGELDILVHYDKWSVRFDEWLKMDSTRIRQAKVKANTEPKKCFYIKEKVTAYWAPDGRYYAAEIVKQLSDDCWNVLFYDGYTKTLRRSHIKKLENTNEDEQIYDKAIKRFSPVEQNEIVDLDSSHSTSSIDVSTTDNSSSETMIDEDEEIYDKPLKRFKPLKQNEDEPMDIDTSHSSSSDDDSTIDESSSVTSVSSLSSTDDLGFKGFDSTSLSAEKYRNKKTLSSLLGLTTLEEDHLCPKKGCGKSFRKENLLRLHMKHYHPKLFKLDKGVVSIAHSTNPVESAENQDAAVAIAKHVTKDVHGNKRINANAIKIEESRKANLLSHNQLKESSSKISAEAKHSYIAALKKKMDIDKSKVCEYKNQKNKKPAEMEESIPDSPDKSDAAEKDDPGAIINCRCGFKEEDGLMLQCDICLCWQHGSCYKIESEEQVPYSYICSICDNSYLQRSSRRFRHHQDWIKEGKLPRFSATEGSTRLESVIRKCHDLMGNVLSVSDVMHSLDLKLNISKKDDHPKLVMWHKKWKDDDETKAKNNRVSGSVSEEMKTEVISTDKVSGSTREDKYTYNNGFGDQLQNVDRLTGLRINGASSQQAGASSAIEIPIDKNEDIDEVFGFALPGLVSEANVGPDLTDLLSSNVELEQLVHQASTELAPMDNQPTPVMQRAPIIPQAERILPVKCKLNLLDHIDKMQNSLFDRFDLIEDHLQALESEMGLTSKFSKEEEEKLCKDGSEGKDEMMIQARALVRMSLRDLDTASKLISYTPS